MSYVADLHIHSPHSRATSHQITFENLARWAGLKGIDLLSSGDFTHPAWVRESRRKLRDVGDGLFEHDGVMFILGTEVNCVARQDGRSRRVHVLLFVPGFGTLDRINTALAGLGNLEGDGRPTLRVSPRDLLEILLNIDDRSMLIPAHAWTPWFGLFGSKSGFDSLEECFGDLSGHIRAIESGLSSDPEMNRRVPSLDDVSIVSFSDAHSLPNLGRELTVLPGVPSYDGLMECLNRQNIDYTVEFFPQEGKYHYSGHRRCGVSLSPAEVNNNGHGCPSCGRPLTLGVMQRVDDLAGDDAGPKALSQGLANGKRERPPFMNLIALRQIIGESLHCGPNTKKAQGTYLGLVAHFGNELTVLTHAPPSEIAVVAGERVAAGVARVRTGDVFIEPGYDGVYGTVKIFPN